jgi:hypothetical protein
LVDLVPLFVASSISQLEFHKEKLYLSDHELPYAGFWHHN